MALFCKHNPYLESFQIELKYLFMAE